MKVSLESPTGGYWSSSEVRAAGQKPPAPAPTGPTRSASESPAVIVDLRSTIKNMEPGRAYDLFGRSEAVDLSNAMPKKDPQSSAIGRLGASKFLDVFSDWTKKLMDHWETSIGSMKNTFGVAKNEATVVSGAALDIIRTFQESQGLRAPEKPSVLKEKNEPDSQYDPDVTLARAGSFSISRSVRGELSTTSFVAFDRGVDVPDDQTTLVDLDSGDATASGLWASILSGPLSSSLSSTDQPSMVGMRRYAVTNGKSGSDAVVAAVLFARDGEGGGVQRASDLYAKFKSLTAEGKRAS